MGKWIDADALHDALKTKQKWVVRCGDKHNEGYTYDQVHFAIDDAPSIDIVFCKECKHWSKAPKTERGWCDKCDGLLEPNFYCADGERRE